MVPTMAKRLVLAVLACGLLAFGVAACGSSDDDKTATKGSTAKGDGGSGTTAPGGSDTGGGAKAKGDPCQWYTAAEMEELLGFPVAMEEQPVADKAKCVYDAPDNYSSVEIFPGDETTYMNDKAFAQSPDGVKLAGEFTPVEGVGDEAFGTQGGGATLNALKGKRSVGILITNGGGGPEAGKIDTDEAAAALAKQIAEKVLA